MLLNWTSFIYLVLRLYLMFSDLSLLRLLATPTIQRTEILRVEEALVAKELLSASKVALLDSVLILEVPLEVRTSKRRLFLTNNAFLVPAGFNGLYGIRPTSGRCVKSLSAFLNYNDLVVSCASDNEKAQSNRARMKNTNSRVLRLPYSGLANSMQGQNSILSVVGPIATSVGSLRLLIKSLLTQEPWLYDPLVNELPWRSEQEQTILDIASKNGGSQLCFGIMRGDGIVKPQPPVLRAIDIVVKTIEKLGHKVIEWKPPSHERCLEITVSFCSFLAPLCQHN